MGEDRSPGIPIRAFPRGPDRTVRSYHTAAFRKGWVRSALLGLLVAILTMGAARFDLFREFELRTVDARFRFRGARPVDSPLAIVFIGEDSIAEFGRWPWSWDHHALLIDVLRRAGARLILFDIFFTESPGRGEALLLGSMAGEAENVYFCSFFTGRTSVEEGSSPSLLEWETLTDPVPELLAGAAGGGHCSALPDIDGNTRRVPLLVRHGDVLVPSLSLRAGSALLGTTPEEIKFAGDDSLVLTADDGRVFSIPLDGEGQTAVNFVGGLDAFPAYSYRQVLQADLFPEQSPVDLGDLRDKVVLVGVTFAGNTDLRPTPFSPIYPMLGIQATMLDNILGGEFVRKPRRAVTVVLWCLLGSFVGGLAFALRPLVSIWVMVLTAGGYLAAAAWGFSTLGWQVELVGPLATVFLAYLLVNTIQFVEARKQKMAYLERMKYLGHLVESAAEAIVSFDGRGKVASWNQGARETFGFREREALGRDWAFLAPPEERDRLEAILGQALAGEDAAGLELTFMKSDGTSIPVSASLSQIRDSRGDVVGLSLISQDLSEKKKMIEVLVQSEKLAEIGRMGSGIVHEIKNPLTSIMMMSGILLSDESLGEKTRKYADIIEKESQRILRLSRNILSFARPKKAEMKNVDLNAILEETLELVEYELKKAKVLVRRDFDGDLPPVRGDGEKLKQVFLNIITNAIHAMEGGGELNLRTSSPGAELPPPEGKSDDRPCCTVGGGEREGLLTLQVRDSGPGIPADVLARIFEPFFSTKGEGKGTGLGLYISRNIVMEHQGIIEACSRIGDGTLFTVFLPPAGQASGEDSGPED